MRSVPGSLVRAQTLAPWFLGVTGFVVILQLLVLMKGELVPIVGGLGVPVLGIATMGGLLARRQWGMAFASIFAIPFAHVLTVGAYAIVDGHGAGGDLGMLAVIVDLVVFVLAFPALAACAVQGPRDDHDAGDVLLGVLGAWFALEQGLFLAVAGKAEEPWMFVVGVAVGVVALVVSIERAIHRRVWTSRVARGLVSGWRVRTDATLAEVPGLAPLFGGHTALAVLERFEAGTTTYRSAPIAHPVALVPAR